MYHACTPALPVCTFTDTFRVSHSRTGALGFNGDCGGGGLEFGGGQRRDGDQGEGEGGGGGATDDRAMEVARAVAPAVRVAAW